jgi:hypothetical protein
LVKVVIGPDLLNIDLKNLLCTNDIHTFWSLCCMASEVYLNDVFIFFYSGKLKVAEVEWILRDFLTPSLLGKQKWLDRDSCMCT